jgi:hypothetical protein
VNAETYNNSLFSAATGAWDTVDFDFKGFGLWKYDRHVRAGQWGREVGCAVSETVSAVALAS